VACRGFPDSSQPRGSSPGGYREDLHRHQPDIAPWRLGFRERCPLPRCGYPRTVADESDTPGERRLPRWSRVALCVALVPVMILGPLVAIGLWPGLNLEWSATPARGNSCGLGTHRFSTTDYRGPSLRAHFAALSWSRFPTHPNSSGRRGWWGKEGSDALLHLRRWEADHWSVSVASPR
jgi:hypothetical protein